MEEDCEFEGFPGFYAEEIEHEEDEGSLAGYGDPLQDPLQEP